MVLWMAMFVALASPLAKAGRAGVHEEAHAGTLTRHGDRVVLQVTRAVRNDEDEVMHLAVDVAIPRDGAVVGLKVSGPGVAELQHVGPMRGGLVFLDVPPGARRRATYTIEAWLEPRRDGTARLWWEAACESCLPLTLSMGKKRLTPVEESPWGLFDLPGERGADGRLRFGAVAAGGRWAWRAEVFAPPTLGAPPKQARVVVLVDRSHSQGPAGLAKQRRIVEALAERMPADARFAIVAYGRKAEALADGFRPAAEALAGWERLAPENGSALDAGLRAAAALLPDGRPDDRVVVITDALLRAALTTEALLAETRPGDAAVHVLVADATQRYGPTAARNDFHPLAPLADRHRGMLQVVRLSGDGPEGPAFVVEALGWPTRIDGLALHLDGAAEADETLARLDAGLGEVWRGVADAEPKAAEVRGRVWAEAWRREARRAAPGAPRAARWGAGGGAEPLTDDEVAALGRAHRIVTRRTALRGDARRVQVVEPADLGLWRFDGGGGTAEARGSWGPKIAELDAGRLSGALSAALRECGVAARGPGGGAPDGPGRVTVETTRDEVVDVRVEGLPAATSACLEEAVWGVRLPAEFTDRHARGALAVSAAPPAGR